MSSREHRWDGGTPTVLVTGATGFIGHRAVHRLLAHEGRPRLRLLVHDRDVPECCAAATAVVRGSLTDPASLRGVCRGVGTVLHLASLITQDPATAHAVNTAGTEALLAEAHRSGVRRFVRLGTAAVYGPGPHRGEPAPSGRPLSVTSASRLAGDRSVLAAGGTVLRPYLVYGAGDVWFVPALVQMITRLPRWIEGGRARLSLISVDDLARVTAALVTRPAPLPASTVLHAAHPRPVVVRDLVTALCRQLGLPLPRGDVSRADLEAHLGGPADADLVRRFAQFGTDHWFDSSELWSLAGLEPGPGFAEQFAACAPWYREHLRDPLPATAPAAG
ncbi:NAD-dependent epimerase/dehydratase family protein [Streptomyces phaeoluteigriseus]|uniref:NAD-dependent epimerase/dehydratase family protein n=1 Tax=Streptomyces phaeoluteigriseus TaxID=114686 RepID=UPI0009A1AB37|nr:NAD-dependent epimerase/dehydratase family protein [Streptomyces phaeoluteigriseus]